MTNIPTIALIGAGNIGSRHLQGLKTLKHPAQIFVIDPSEISLKTAKSRYRSDETALKSNQQVAFSTNLSILPDNIDLSIIATNSLVRRKVTELILKRSEVRNIIFEKLLFSQKSDYAVIGKLLNKRNINAWINCSMRTMPFYHNMKSAIGKKVVNYTVTGSNYGLVTNAIHYLDHMIYLTDCTNFIVDATNLKPHPIPSKREGFLEFHGTLTIKMANGSLGNFVCYPEGDHPLTIEVSTPYFHCLSNESEKKAWVSISPDWKWAEQSDTVLYQSEMTGQIADEILKTGGCDLPAYTLSSKTHLVLLDKLLNHLKKHLQYKYNNYPFT